MISFKDWCKSILASVNEDGAIPVNNMSGGYIAAVDPPLGTTKTPAVKALKSKKILRRVGKQ